MKMSKKLLAFLLAITLTASSFVSASATEVGTDEIGTEQQESTEENSEAVPQDDIAGNIEAGTEAADGTESVENTENVVPENTETVTEDDGIALLSADYSVAPLALADSSDTATGTKYEKVGLVSSPTTTGRTLEEDGDYLMVFQKDGRYYAMTSVHDGTESNEKPYEIEYTAGRMLTADVTEYVYDNGASIVLSDADLISRAEWQITYDPFDNKEGYYDFHGNGGNGIAEGYLRITWHSLYIAEMDENKMTIGSDGTVYRERSQTTGNYYMSNYSYEGGKYFATFTEQTGWVTGLGNGSGIGNGVSESSAKEHATKFTFYKKYNPPKPTYDITVQFIVDGVNDNNPISIYTTEYKNAESPLGINIPAVIKDNMELVSFEPGTTGATNNNGILNDISASGTVTYTYCLKDGYSMNTNADGILTQKTITDNGDGTYALDLKVQGTPTTETSSARKPVDIVMVFDVSGSMGYTDNTSTTRLKEAQTAAINFAESLLEDTTAIHRIGVVKFATGYSAYNYKSYSWQGTDSAAKSATISGGTYFSSDITTVKRVINGLQANGGTNSEGGFDGAKQILKTARDGAVTAVIYLTDGVPTYSLSSADGGSSTTDKEFNDAVSKAASIKSEKLADKIFTIGLIRGYTEGSDDYNTCKYLLSDEYYYTRSSSSYSKNTSKTAYADKSYLISSADAANTSSLLSQIYQDIQSSITVTVAGTVTDTIPAEFELTEESENALKATYGDNITITENANGTTTIAIKDVAADVVASKISTYKVQPKEGMYGVAYTNENTSYNYGDSRSLPFKDPVAPISPVANPDAYYTKANTVITIDPKSNDGDLTKVSDAGFTVSDLTIELYSDAAGKVALTNVENKFEVTTNANGTITFTPLTTGQFTFYYKVKATVTAPEGKKNVNGTATTAGTYYNIPSELTSPATKVDVFAYKTSDKAYVLDYGLPVTIPESDLTSGDVIDIDNDAATTQFGGFQTSRGQFGTLTKSGTSYTYTPEKYMSDADVFAAPISVTEDTDINPKEEYNSVELTKNLKFVPASVVYYEENFGSNSSSTADKNTANNAGYGIYFSGTWTSVSSATSGNGTQDYAQDTPYGSDSEYAGDAKFSNGSAVTSTEIGATAEFTFTGTGFDIISKTDTNQAVVAVQVWDTEQVTDGSYTATNRELIKLVNTYCKDGDLYQIPILNIDMETRGTYRVLLTISPVIGSGDTTTSANLYIDGIRIYNPLADETAKEYYQAGEYQAEISEIRDLILEQQNVAYVDAADTANINVANGTTYVDQKGNVREITDYLAVGPNNEVYLKNNQGIAFYVTLNDGVNAADATLQVAAKAPSGSASMQYNYGNVQTISTATEMYYEIDLTKLTPTAGKYLVVIASKSDNILSLTNLKTKGITLTADINAGILDDVQYSGTFASEVNETIEVKDSWNLTVAKGGKDTTVYVTTSNDAAGIVVYDVEGNLCTISKMTKRASGSNYIWTVKFQTKATTRLFERQEYTIKAYDEAGKVSVSSDTLKVTVRR